VPAVRDADRVFLTPAGMPRLVRCAVLFLDLLGVRALNSGPPAEVTARLVTVERALRGTYRDFLAPDSPWSSSIFSDSLVLAAPLGDEAATAVTVGGLVDQAARLHVSLLEHGLFARGGLAVDWFHIRDGFVFGPALVEAYRLESKVAVHPRIVLADAAAAILGRDLAAGGLAARHRLLRDADGMAFVDYLQIPLEERDAVAPRLARHRDEILAALDAHVGRRAVWEKYRWLGEYHNACIATSALPASEAETLLVPSQRLAWGFHAFA
jgi:hypothetical protein